MDVLVELYRTQIIDTGKQALFLLLVAFIVTFLFIRFSVRMIRAGVSWWPGNISSGDVHVHHVVFGMVCMLVAGLLAFAPAGWESPWWEILGALFGIGAALVLDEFALILHLEDVYWSERGRKSVDAVVLGAAVTALLVLGVLPFGIDGIGGDTALGRWAYVIAIVVDGADQGEEDHEQPEHAEPEPALEERDEHERAVDRARRHDARWRRLKHRVFDAVAGRPHIEPEQPTG